jgi:DNA polymerase III alpha subunit (gram-positive type)
MDDLVVRTFIAIDTETNGLDPAVNKIVEIGYAIFDADRRRLMSVGGWFVNRSKDTDAPDSRDEIPPEAFAVNQIEAEWVRLHGVSEEMAVVRLNELFALPGTVAIVGHNLRFDTAMMAAVGWVPTVQAIDTMTDLPMGAGNKSLAYAALDHKVLSFFGHRAAWDSVQTGKILCTYQFDEILARSKSPQVILAADVSFRENDKAKRLFFHWERPNRFDNVRVPKAWVKSLKEIDLRDEQVRCGKAGVMTHVVEMPAATNGDTK